MEQLYVYKNLNEVPSRWKTYKGVRLSLSQINEIVKLAYDNKISTEFGDIPDYGVARSIFEDIHVIENGLWASK